MKKIIVGLGFLMMLFCGEITTQANSVTVQAAENEEILIDKRNENTIQSAEKLLIDYLQSKGQTTQVNTSDFTDYIREQIMNETDKELINLDEYDSIYVYMSEYLTTLNEYLFENENLDGFSMNSKYELSINSILEKNKTENEKILARENTLQIKPRVGKWGTLNLSKAKSYAKKYYKTRNSSYKNFSGLGGNCTNFVSQILVAAGGNQTAPSNWKNQKEVYGTKNYWYSKKNGKQYKISSSFVRVSDLYAYWNFVGKTFSAKDWKKSISYASAGDIIQYQDKAGSWYHSGFIYRKNNTNLYVSMNDSNYLERAVSDSIKTSKAIRIIKTYMN